MSNNNDHGKNQQQQLTLSSYYHHYGQLPPANEFAGYEQTLPCAADRILTMAEKEAEHRRENDNKLTNASIKLSGRRQVMALVIS
ncbi:MAG: DUF2335 domain-containing protein [Spirochaetaceae bacterium]|jgi:uncharacterized membrane protein|nr:DUF2335 domain-containing protein [Spirochaetaceae bacterium]